MTSETAADYYMNPNIFYNCPRISNPQASTSQQPTNTSRNVATTITPSIISNTESLWQSSISFQWQSNTLHPTLGDYRNSNRASFKPYLVCHSGAKMGGLERFNHLMDLFQSADIDYDMWYLGYDSVYNELDRSCYFFSATVGVWESLMNYMSIDESVVITTNGAGGGELHNETLLDVIRIQPLVPSMKLVGNLVEGIIDRMKELAKEDRDQSGSSGEKRSDSLKNNEDTTVLDVGDYFGLDLTLCPVASDKKNPLTFDDIISAIKQFMTYQDGTSVLQSSFYVSDQTSECVSDRIKFWSNNLQSITSSDPSLKQYDDCINAILDTEIEFDEVSSETIQVVLKKEVMDVFTTEVLESCTWYALQAVALHPYVCRISPKLKVGVEGVEGGLNNMGDVEGPNVMMTSGASHQKSSCYHVWLIIGVVYGLYSLY